MQVDVLESLASLDGAELLDLTSVARCLGITVIGDGMDHHSLTPSGYRLLHRIPRLPGAIVDRLVEHFGSFDATYGSIGAIIVLFVYSLVAGRRRAI